MGICGLDERGEVLMTLKEIRLDRKWSQADVARFCGVSISLVRRWESGLSEPSLLCAVKLCDLYDLSINQLAGAFLHIKDPNTRHNRRKPGDVFTVTLCEKCGEWFEASQDHICHYENSYPKNSFTVDKKTDKKKARKFKKCE